MDKEVVEKIIEHKKIRKRRELNKLLISLT
jgi:hypothetical protein